MAAGQNQGLAAAHLVTDELVRVYVSDGSQELGQRQPQFRAEGPEARLVGAGADHAGPPRLRGLRRGFRVRPGRHGALLPLLRGLPGCGLGCGRSFDGRGREHLEAQEPYHRVPTADEDRRLRRCLGGPVSGLWRGILERRDLYKAVSRGTRGLILLWATCCLIFCASLSSDLRFASKHCSLTLNSSWKVGIYIPESDINTIIT